MSADTSPDWAKNMFGETIGIEAYGYLARENRKRRLGEEVAEIVLADNTSDDSTQELTSA